MKAKRKSEDKGKSILKRVILIIILIAVIINIFFISLGIVADLYQSGNIQNDNISDINRSLFIDYFSMGEKYFDEGYNYLEEGEKLFANASDNYDLGFVNNTYYYCRLARIKYKAAPSSFIKAIKFYEKAREYGYDDLVKAAIELAEYGENLSYIKYEACEYFESAALNYNQCSYYKEEAYCDEGDYYIGEYNKIIEKHDALVRQYNRKLAEKEALMEFYGFTYEDFNVSLTS